MSEKMGHEYEVIDEFSVIGVFGCLRFEGSFDVEKEGTKWTITIPDDYSHPSLTTLPSLDGEAVALVADCRIVGAGILDFVLDPQGEGEIHVVVDQYMMGDDGE